MQWYFFQLILQCTYKSIKDLIELVFLFNMILYAQANKQTNLIKTFQEVYLMCRVNESKLSPLIVLFFILHMPLCLLHKYIHSG